MTPQEIEDFFDDLTLEVQDVMYLLEGDHTGYMTYLEGTVVSSTGGVLKVLTPTFNIYYTSKGQQREGERVYNKIQEVMNTHNVDKLRFEKRLISNNTYEIYAYIVDETGQVINLQ